jgi:gamma-glutamyltranspeptidase/glutathione hydrolase
MTLSGDRPVGRLHGTRSPVRATRGVVATSQPLASAAGLQVLHEGGNAVDAAVTAAATLAVVEPTMTGVGGDLFALVRDGKTGSLTALNSSGRAGARADADALAARGITALPLHGPLTVTIPGSVAGWAELLRAHGTIPLPRALAPAIRYARDGFPVSEIVAAQWEAVAPRLAVDPEAARVLRPGGRAPAAGEMFRNPDLASTLERIARGGPAVLYEGPIGAAIAAHIERVGGFLTAADFARHRADWVDPISTTYRGRTVCELPPNTQGFVALEMLNILEGFDVVGMGHNSADFLHVYSEAKRIAFADRAAYSADPDRVPPELLARLISKAYAADRRAQIDMRRAAASYDPAAPAVERRGDTVYLAAADGSGTVVSLINSLFDSFGSGIVVPGTGIALHCRGAGFTLAPGHPNRLAPGKRPAHTLVPAMLIDGERVMAFGVMGADNQAQAHAQVVVNIVDFGMNVQDAGEVTRVRHFEDGLAVESGVPEHVRAALRARGHAIQDGRGLMGGYQGVRIDRRTGIIEGGSDPRKDGLAIGW